MKTIHKLFVVDGCYYDPLTWRQTTVRELVAASSKYHAEKEMNERYHAFRLLNMRRYTGKRHSIL